MRSRFRQEKRREGGKSFPDKAARGQPTGFQPNSPQRESWFPLFGLLSDLVVI